LDVLTVTNAVAGVRFGPYSILEKIGSGGMGEVYRALNTRLDCEVALKLVSQSYLSGDTAHIPPPSLKQYLAGRRRLPAPELLTFAAAGRKRACRGACPWHYPSRHQAGQHFCDAADRRAVAYQDSGRQAPGVNSADSLGAPTGIDPGMLNGDRTEGGELTSAASTLGTIAYMSPEQANGQGLEARSDLFSLGSVLYEAATGASPFVGGSTTEILAALLIKDAPPASSVNPDCTRNVDKLVLAV
jgi:serine/threonine-protein kinase